MKVYLTSNIPIQTLRESYTNGAPADFLLEDLLEIAQHNDTCVVNELSIALEKLKNKKIKFLYEIEIKEF
jgi:hypothetical protein